jgi:monoamine oxidase
MVAQGTSADPEELGVKAGALATYDGDGERRHFRLLAGYSDLMRRAAGGLDIRLSMAVSRVEWSKDGVRVEAGRQTFEGQVAVVTLPLGVLASGEVAFAPDLPPEKAAAIARINPGAIGKVVLKFDEVVWPPDLTFLWTSRDTQLWWRPGQGQPNEDAVITAFFGGRDARVMGALSGDDAAASAVADLEAITGKRLSGRLLNYRVLVWNNEPYTRMGYSSLPPGGRDLRAALAAPAGVLFFAGEATNAVRPATVHGAIESGIRAADEAVGYLNR